MNKVVWKNKTNVREKRFDELLELEIALGAAGAST
jgi:hypothetical protein